MSSAYPNARATPLLGAIPVGCPARCRLPPSGKDVTARSIRIRREHAAGRVSARPPTAQRVRPRRQPLQAVPALPGQRSRRLLIQNHQLTPLTPRLAVRVIPARPLPRSASLAVPTRHLSAPTDEPARSGRHSATSTAPTASGRAPRCNPVPSADSDSEAPGVHTAAAAHSASPPTRSAASDRPAEPSAPAAGSAEPASDSAAPT